MVELQSQLVAASKDRSYAQSILYAGAPPSGFGEDTKPYYERKARKAALEVRALADSIAHLEDAIGAKAFSVSALAGALLQVAKQGLVISYGSLQACPPGRLIGSENLKNVIWQGRNQAIHWEEGAFSTPVTTCFQNLEQAFGEGFKLDGTGVKSLAKNVIGLLEWSDYSAYVRDMSSIID